jgi:hypothetical protein
MEQGNSTSDPATSTGSDLAMDGMSPSSHPSSELMDDSEDIMTHVEKAAKRLKEITSKAFGQDSSATSTLASHNAMVQVLCTEVIPDLLHACARVSEMSTDELEKASHRSTEEQDDSQDKVFVVVTDSIGTITEEQIKSGFDSIPSSRSLQLVDIKHIEPFLGKKQLVEITDPTLLKKAKGMMKDQADVNLSNVERNVNIKSI